MIAGLTGLAAVAFLPSLTAYFVADDMQSVRLWSGRELLRDFLWGRDRLFYRPLADTVFAMEYRLWGINPTPYHLLRLAWHTANALLAGLLLRRAGLSRRLAVSAAALFAVHPVHGGIVPWISNLFELQCFFFELAALIIALIYLRSGRRPMRYLAAIALLTGCALLSKGMAVRLPALILLLWLLPAGRGRGKRMMAATGAAAVTVAGYLAYRMTALGSIEVYGNVTHLRAGTFLAEHLALYWQRAWFSELTEHITLWLAVLGVAGMVIGSRVSRWGLAFFGAALLPAINVEGDRFLYAPVLGIAIAAADAANWPARKWPGRIYGRIILPAIAAGVLVAWGAGGCYLGSLDWRHAGELVQAVPKLFNTSHVPYENTTAFVAGLPRTIGRAFVYTHGMPISIQPNLRVMRLTPWDLPRIPVPPPQHSLRFFQLSAGDLVPLTSYDDLFAELQRARQDRSFYLPEWDFSDPSTRADWILYNGLRWIDSGWGWRQLVSSSPDPFMIRPELAIPMRHITGLRLIITVKRSGGEAVGAVYWICRGDEQWSESKRVLFVVPDDQRYHTVDVPLLGQPGWDWRDTLTALRIDPINGEGEVLLTRISLLTAGQGLYRPTTTEDFPYVPRHKMNVES